MTRFNLICSFFNINHKISRFRFHRTSSMALMSRRLKQVVQAPGQVAPGQQLLPVLFSRRRWTSACPAEGRVHVTPQFPVMSWKLQTSSKTKRKTISARAEHWAAVKVASLAGRHVINENSRQHAEDDAKEDFFMLDGWLKRRKICWLSE